MIFEYSFSFIDKHYWLSCMYTFSDFISPPKYLQYNTYNICLCCVVAVFLLFGFILQEKTWHTDGDEYDNVDRFVKKAAVLVCTSITDIAANEH